MQRILCVLGVLASCNKAGPPPQETPARDPAAGTPVVAAPRQVPDAAVAAEVELTAVTLADDCGGTPPTAPPPAAGAPRGKRAPTQTRSELDASAGRLVRAKRRCEQTSMQVAVTASAATTIQVKSVELFDQAGTSLGTLAASSPTRWSEATSTYEAWDGRLDAGATAMASYVLSAPAWDRIGDRWNKTFTLKTVLGVGGTEQAAQRDVLLTAPASLPPNVRT